MREKICHAFTISISLSQNELNIFLNIVETFYFIFFLYFNSLQCQIVSSLWIPLFLSFVAIYKPNNAMKISIAIKFSWKFQSWLLILMLPLPIFSFSLIRGARCISWYQNIGSPVASQRNLPRLLLKRAWNRMKNSLPKKCNERKNKKYWEDLRKE